FGRARITWPRLPLSLPDRTITLSFLCIFISQHLRSERDYAHEALVSQLSSYWPKYARPAGLHLVIDEHSSVLVETDITTIGPALFFPGPDDDTLHDVALFHVRPGDRVL